MRDDLGLTRKDVAAKGFLGEQTLWRLEGGQGPYNEGYIRGLCARYGTEDRLEKLLDQARRTYEESWWEASGAKYGVLFDVELEARKIIDVGENLINGLLQTPRYHLAVCELLGADEPVPVALKIRQERQAQFWARTNVQLTVIMNERALTDDWGDPDMMAEQMEHIRGLLPRKGLDVRYLPAGVVHEAIETSFKLMEIDKAETLVFIGGLDGDRWAGDSEGVSKYRSVARAVMRRSVPLSERFR